MSSHRSFDSFGFLAFPPSSPIDQPPIGLINDMAKQIQERMDELMPGQMALMIQASYLAIYILPAPISLFQTPFEHNLHPG